MSGIRSALTEIASWDVHAMLTGDLADLATELAASRDILDAQLTRVVRELDIRAPLDDLGYQGPKNLLIDRSRMSAGHAAELVKVGRALQHMPATQAAFTDGTISYAQTRVYVGAATAHPEHFADDEEALLDTGGSLPVRELTTLLNRWEQIVDAVSVKDRAERDWERRGLHISETFEGKWRLDGWADPESGTIIATAIRALAEKLDPEDDRTPTQRRLDALTEICRDFLSHADTPTEGGERPHITVITDIPFLHGEPGGTAHLENTTRQLPRSTVERLLCDATVTVYGTCEDHHTVDWSRARNVPRWLRRLVVSRDHHCQFSGCYRPPRWCDAHHIKWWRNGGLTELDNLALLCSYHHHLIHNGGWTMERLPTGELQFTRPDGTSITNRAPP